MQNLHRADMDLMILQFAVNARLVADQHDGIAEFIGSQHAAGNVVERTAVCAHRIQRYAHSVLAFQKMSLNSP